MCEHVPKHVGIINDVSRKELEQEILYGVHTVSTVKLPEGTSLIIWEEQWGVFLKFKKKMQENKENTRRTWQSLIILSVNGLLLLAADTQFTDHFPFPLFSLQEQAG